MVNKKCTLVKNGKYDEFMEFYCILLLYFASN